MSSESKEELLTRHRKEVKSLDGERRASVKKIKGTAGKGKKGKEAVAAVEAEYDAKEREMKERHATELAGAASSTASAPADDDDDESKPAAEEGAAQPPPAASAAIVADPNNDAEAVKEKKISKARRKKLRAQEKQRQRELEIEREREEAGPSPREMELNVMNELYLKPANLSIREIPSDGNCLYRAVSDQLGLHGGGDDNGQTKQQNLSYQELRHLCATTLLERSEEYSPFAELDHHNVDTFEEYVEKVRSSDEWGGQLELRALAVALRRPIVVYSADAGPLTMGEEFGDDGEEALRVSFHRRYYDLGEHYNSVAAK